MTLRADLGALIRNPSRWWHRATHAPCPVCGKTLNVGREWQDHKATHDPQEWQAAVSGQAS